MAMKKDSRLLSGKTPPKIHDLLRLAEMGGLQPDEETKALLGQQGG